MAEEINPAMTPDEWAYFTAPGVRKHTLQDAIGAAERGRMDLHSHALAALALHGQGYGFNREDVVYLRACGSTTDTGHGEMRDDRLLNIAERIAALLPEEEGT